MVTAASPAGDKPSGSSAPCSACATALCDMLFEYDHRVGGKVPGIRTRCSEIAGPSAAPPTAASATLRFLLANTETSTPAPRDGSAGFCGTGRSVDGLHRLDAEKPRWAAAVRLGHVADPQRRLPQRDPRRDEVLRVLRGAVRKPQPPFGGYKSPPPPMDWPTKYAKCSTGSSAVHEPLTEAFSFYLVFGAEGSTKIRRDPMISVLSQQNSGRQLRATAAHKPKVFAKPANG